MINIKKKNEKTPHCQNSSKIWKLRDQPLPLTHMHDRSLFLDWYIMNFYTLCMFYFPLLRIACNNKNNLPKRLDVFSINWNQEKNGTHLYDSTDKLLKYHLVWTILENVRFEWIHNTEYQTFSIKVISSFQNFIIIHVITIKYIGCLIKV